MTYIANSTDVLDKANNQSIPDIPIAEGTTEICLHGKSDVWSNECLKQGSMDNKITVISRPQDTSAHEVYPPKNCPQKEKFHR